MSLSFPMAFDPWWALGARLPDGDLFVVALFLKVFVPRQSAELFKTLALSAKVALLPFHSSSLPHDVLETPKGHIQTTQHNAQVVALEQLLAVHEEAVMTYATERMQAETALQDSEARFSAMVHSTKDVVLFIDHTGCIKSWNEAAERLFGYSFQEAYGKPGQMIFESGFEAVVQKVADGSLAESSPSRRCDVVSLEPEGRRTAKPFRLN